MGKRILYVEDEPFFASTLDKIFSGAGFSVAIAKDGEEGLALAGKERFDLILLDLLLPKVDGFEVLRRLKADQATRDVPVVVLSNLGSDEDKRRTSELGAPLFFVKALMDPKKLVTHIEHMVGSATGA
jgi:DNA-binding response OmpR family regulator